MSITTGFLKYKRYIKLSNGNYQLISHWTSSDTVQMSGSGNTLSTDLGSIRGITDSLTSTSSNIALSAKSGKSLQDQITTVNSNLDDKVSKTGDAMSSGLTLPFIELKGNAQTSNYIDFHYNNSSADYTSRIVEVSSGVINIAAPNGVKLNGTAISPVGWVQYTFNSGWHGAISALKCGQFLLFSIAVYCDNSIELWQEVEIAGALDIQPTTTYDFSMAAQDNSGTAYNGQSEYDGGNFILATRGTALPANCWVRGSGWGFLDH